MGATWDALGRPKTESLYRGTRTTEDSTKSYTYDAGGRLYSVVASCAGQADETILRSVTYNARGQRLVVERGTKAGTSPATPSLTTRYLYDSSTFRILRIYTERDTSGGVSVLQDLRYVHDAVGNITHRFNAHDSTVWFSNAPVTPHQYFWYDALDRLVQARGRENDTTFHLSEGGFGARRQKNVPYGRGPHAHPNDASALRRYTQVYNYDAVGNLALVKHHLGDLGTVLAVRTYRYTNSSGAVVDGAYAEPFTPLFNNQLAATVVDGTTYSYGYDEHGNMDLPHLVAQSWSPLNRLHSIQATAAWSADGDSPTPMGTTEDHDWFYVYAADGQRARKVRASGTTGAVRSEERFYLGAFEVWREYVSGSHASATSAGTPETERETWHVSDDKGRLAMGETKTWSGGAVVSSLVPRWRLQLGDHLHTAVAEVTEAGAIISYEEYHPYGTTAFQSVDSSVDVSRKRYRYTGMERDDETGLQYHHHRYYAPWLGRWTRPDPAGLVDGDNAFCYARNRPTGGWDSSGLATKEQLVREKVLLTLGSNGTEAFEEITIRLAGGEEIRIRPDILSYDNASGRFELLELKGTENSMFTENQPSALKRIAAGEKFDIRSDLPEEFTARTGIKKGSRVGADVFVLDESNFDQWAQGRVAAMTPADVDAELGRRGARKKKVDTETRDVTLRTDGGRVTQIDVPVASQKRRREAAMAAFSRFARRITPGATLVLKTVTVVQVGLAASEAQAKQDPLGTSLEISSSVEAPWVAWPADFLLTYADLVGIVRGAPIDNYTEFYKEKGDGRDPWGDRATPAGGDRNSMGSLRME